MRGVWRRTERGRERKERESREEREEKGEEENPACTRAPHSERGDGQDWEAYSAKHPDAYWMLKPVGSCCGQVRLLARLLTYP